MGILIILSYIIGTLLWFQNLGMFLNTLRLREYLKGGNINLDESLKNIFNKYTDLGKSQDHYFFSVLCLIIIGICSYFGFYFLTSAVLVLMLLVVINADLFTMVREKMEENNLI